MLELRKELRKIRGATSSNEQIAQQQALELYKHPVYALKNEYGGILISEGVMEEFQKVYPLPIR